MIAAAETIDTPLAAIARALHILDEEMLTLDRPEQTSEDDRRMTEAVDEEMALRAAAARLTAQSAADAAIQLQVADLELDALLASAIADSFDEQTSNRLDAIHHLVHSTLAALRREGR